MDQHPNIYPAPSFYLEKCIQNRKRLLEQFKNTNFNKQYPSIQENSEQSIHTIEPPQDKFVQENIKQQYNSGCSEIKEPEIQQIKENNQSNQKKILLQFKFKTKLSQQIQSNELSNLSAEQSTVNVDTQIISKNLNTVETQTDLTCNLNLEKEKKQPKLIDDQCQTTEDIPIQTLIIQQMKEDALKPNKQWYSINLNSSIHHKLLVTDQFMSVNKAAIDYFDSLKSKLNEN
ncbi:unnamed protein product (macronuclear) [Paramecium tetraurelia]|uniref:Uncharacterized protein n=1 Tax=Paramecium tetraurelia TaxID=5888 RepID=A0DZC8_PARTE|nr:uncharacterized protein GSPATT00003364001 [Paramecium tetraurelia]CAK88395.1 unnamed protein product [Paramecium tetraurelia]|eukprot:XP_001455792.1 hypothetical protein (macronuclear) [Paramecium tetraurelia strain d4-2]